MIINNSIFLYRRSVNFRESENEHAIIKRAEYTEDAHIKVWVTARNVLGTANSQEHEFNTGHISKSLLHHTDIL